MDFSINGIRKWILWVTLVTLLNVKGETFNPQNDKGTFVVCIERTEPLRIANPFNPDKADDSNFMLLEWLKKGENVSDTRIMAMEPQADAEFSINDNRFSLFEFWGIQITGVKYEDSGTYQATYMSIKKNGTEVVSVDVVVASPPTLKSKKLEMKVVETGDKKMLMCGNVNSLGIPPVKLAIMADNGTALNAKYKAGYLSLELESEADTGKFSCGIIEDLSPAKTCITAVDLHLWDSSLHIGAASSSSAGTAGIIAAGVVTLILLVIITLVIVCIILKRRKNRSEADKVGHDTNSEEGKRLGSPPTHSDEEDDEDPYNRSVNSAPYLSSKQSSATPYMVTGFKMGEENSTPNHYASTMPSNRMVQPNSRSSPIYKEPPVARPEDDDVTDLSYSPARQDRNRNVKGKSKTLDNRKSWAGVVGQMEERQQQQQHKQQQQPPTPMKRNVRYTRSNDGLNLIDDEERRRGDLGGGGEHAGTLV